MSAYLRKEIRLLLPSICIALVAALGVWLIPDNNGESISTLRKLTILFPVVVCPGLVVMAGLDSFGREISSNTFSNLLAQPISRNQIWWTKVFLLVVALLIVFGAWWISFLLHVPDFFRGMPSEMHKILVITLMILICSFSGGLWSVLLLRQVGAAFWFTVIVPSAIAVLTGYCTDKFGSGFSHERNIVMALVTYSIAGFFWARWMFLRAQDVAWTGGTVTLPTLRNWLSRGEVIGLRKSHPLVALFRKEFQFQQMSQLLAVLLFVANICVLFMQKVVTVSHESILNILFDGFSFLWLIMPLMIGCSAVAEERRLGTLEPQLCLPVSRARQFLVKLAAVVLFAVLLGAIPIFLTHFIAIGFGLKGDGILLSMDTESFLSIATASVIISLIAFYASTLCKQFLQALAATIGCGVAWFFLGNWLLRHATVGGSPLWEGPIGAIVAGGVGLCLAFGLLSWRGRWRLFLGLLCFWILMALAESFFIGGGRLLSALPRAGISSGQAGYFLIAGPFLLLLVLAFRNFRHVHSGPGLWLKNFAVWFAAFLLTTALAAAAYHRVWEF